MLSRAERDEAPGSRHISHMNSQSSRLWTASFGFLRIGHLLKHQWEKVMEVVLRMFPLNSDPERLLPGGV